MPETKVAVGVIFENETDKYILLLHNNDGFRLPYDHQRHGETTSQAAERIVKEHLGLNVLNFEGAGWRDEIYQGDTHYVSLIYTVAVDGEVDLYDEKSVWDWIPVGVAANMELQFDHQELIKLI
jgi:ADP-ribose pyrophosphatase YjhB (NUDIX family)